MRPTCTGVKPRAAATDTSADAMTDQTTLPDLQWPPAWICRAFDERWGELSVDQPDGFGSGLDDAPSLPSLDISDDLGYGHGV